MRIYISVGMEVSRQGRFFHLHLRQQLCDFTTQLQKCHQVNKILAGENKHTHTRARAVHARTHAHTHTHTHTHRTQTYTHACGYYANCSFKIRQRNRSSKTLIFLTLPAATQGIINYTSATRDAGDDTCSNANLSFPSHSILQKSCS